MVRGIDSKYILFHHILKTLKIEMHTNMVTTLFVKCLLIYPCSSPRASLLLLDM